MSNDHPELLEIHPYLEGSSTWVFNDESTGLEREPFVSGMSEMISELVSHTAAGLAELAVKDYAEFESQLQHYLLLDYVGLSVEDVAEVYDQVIGSPAPGWE